MLRESVEPKACHLVGQERTHDLQQAAQLYHGCDCSGRLDPLVGARIRSRAAFSRRHPAYETHLIDAMRNRPTRSLSTEEREKIASIASSKPKIDLEINFEFNSAVIGSKALPQATELGKALTSADLNGRTFILAGFTDAKGSLTYNQGLSERRADAVKQFLSEKYGIEASRLVTVGYGATKLKNSENPLAGENRRVQIVNASDN